MTVQISKPAFNLREALTSLKRKIGLKGAEIMKAETVDDVYNVIGTNRNWIINGDFDIWQRGTTKSGNGFGADRWVNNYYNSGTCGSERKADAVGMPFVTYIRLYQSVAGTVNDRQALYQNIEGLRLVGQVVTVSFWARASKPISSCRVRELFVGSSSSAGYRYFDVDTTWRKFSFTGVAQQSSSDPMSRLNIDLGANNDTWTLDIANVQVELGYAASPFEYRPYAAELALCQRYCYGLLSIANGDPVGVGQAYTTTAAIIGIAAPVPLRATPTVTRSGLSVWSASGADIFITGLTVSSLRGNYVRLDVTVSSGLGVGNAVFLQGTSSPSGSGALILSAEL